MPTFKGTQVKLYGKPLALGQNAPIVTLVANDLSEITVGGASNVYQIISTMPSIDTGVCQTQARVFNQKASSLANTKVYCISADLPFALSRFCGAEGIKDVSALSDFRDKLFGKVYGLLLQDSPLQGLLTRAVLVINQEGKIIYQEICDEITSEPDYDKALSIIK
ncbi:thiol peroxidase [Helicobacter aurati]|uniref:Thiol peroxidase n=1 Tax=Helicobacter aurati TaxID=137778 RepID=A0A3D8J8H9_9HELI|nr:thiol peroxidase [Helicobacter aurati]RDU73809.1 thiol peroxidase [Helicobacter aurati]